MLNHELMETERLAKASLMIPSYQSHLINLHHLTIGISEEFFSAEDVFSNVEWVKLLLILSNYFILNQLIGLFHLKLIDKIFDP